MKDYMTDLNMRAGKTASFIVDGYPTTAVPVASNGRAVALVYAAFGDGEEIARLFAASPDMLSLLKQLRRAYSDSIDTKLAAIWDGVISKAEGAN